MTINSFVNSSRLWLAWSTICSLYSIETSFPTALNSLQKVIPALFGADHGPEICDLLASWHVLPNTPAKLKPGTRQQIFCNNIAKLYHQNNSKIPVIIYSEASLHLKMLVYSQFQIIHYFAGLWVLFHICSFHYISMDLYGKAPTWFCNSLDLLPM